MQEQKRRMRKRDIYGLVALVVAWCCVIGGLITYHGAVKSENSQNTSAQYSARMANMNYRQTKQQVMQKFNQESLNSKDPTVRAIARNSVYNSMALSTCNKFFMIYNNWHNHTEYVARAKKESNLATPSVLHNKYYFDDDKDSSGASIVDAEQDNSQYNDCSTYIINNQGSQLTVLADVKTDYWASGMNAVTGETWYKMGLNARTGKINSMQKLYHNPNIEQNKV